MNKHIKKLIEGIFDDNLFNSDSDVDLLKTIYKYHPKTYYELNEIIMEHIKKDGYECDLNDIDTSHITNMERLFMNSKFNGDISMWDVSNVTNMYTMFDNSEFNGDISNWDVSNVKHMGNMFFGSKFNGNLSLWNVSNVTDMSAMFKLSKFDGDISNWDVSNVKNMEHMFLNAEFNKDISKWDVSNVENMDGMFCYSKFCQDISKWNINPDVDIPTMLWSAKLPKKYKPKRLYSISEGIFDDDLFDSEPIELTVNLLDKIKLGKYHPDTKLKLITIMRRLIKRRGNDCDLNDIDTSKITDMESLFTYKALGEFNGDISNWDVSNVTDMSNMFYRSSFNGDISGWDVSHVTNMSLMFLGSIFNQNIRFWDVSSVENMSYMFSYSKFKGDISRWNVSNVTDMSSMFGHSKFNGDISKWNVSNVQNMIYMFEESKFNGDISRWDVSNVKRMFCMFYKSKFNQDISSWNLNSECSIINIFSYCPIKLEYKPKLAVTMNEEVYYSEEENNTYIVYSESPEPDENGVYYEGTSLLDAEENYQIQIKDMFYYQLYDCTIYVKKNGKIIAKCPGSDLNKYIKYWGDDMDLDDDELSDYYDDAVQDEITLDYFVKQNYILRERI